MIIKSCIGCGEQTTNAVYCDKCGEKKKKKLFPKGTDKPEKSPQ